MSSERHWPKGRWPLWIITNAIELPQNSCRNVTVAVTRRRETEMRSRCLSDVGSPTVLATVMSADSMSLLQVLWYDMLESAQSSMYYLYTVEERAQGENSNWRADSGGHQPGLLAWCQSSYEVIVLPIMAGLPA